MTITIYGVYRSRASRNVWLCLEAGIPFRMKPVFQPDRTMPPGSWTTKSPEFLAVNPAGMIPCMKDGRLVLSESLAINLYLARNYASPLGPKSAAEDALMTQWTLWAASVVEPHTIQVLYHRTRNPYGATDPAKATEAVEALRRHFAVLDAHLAGSGGFMVGSASPSPTSMSRRWSATPCPRPSCSRRRPMSTRG